MAARYELVEALSGSPLRHVFRAVDREVEVEVALWLVSTDGYGSVEQALASAERSRRLRSPHALRLFDAGNAGHGERWIYLSWQLGTSATLESLLASGTPATPEQIWRLAEGIGGALVAAHSTGVAHGWLSTADVVEVAGQVKLCGLGLQAELDANWVIPRWKSGARYLAPELCKGSARRGSAASDVYSFAAILVDVASGLSQLPLEASQGFVATHLPALWQWLAPLMTENPTLRAISLASALEGIRIALAQPVTRRVAPTIVDERLSSEEDLGLGGLLCDDSDDDEDATEIHVSEGGANLPGAPLPERSAPMGRAATTAPIVGGGSEKLSGGLGVAVSMKAGHESSPHTPKIEPVAALPKPKLRSLTSLPAAAAVRQDLGNFAPPRRATEHGQSRKIWLALACALALAGGVGSVVLALGGNSPAPQRGNSETPPGLPEQPIQAPPAAILTAGPDGMVQHRASEGPGFCIDPFESPGKGRTPQAGLPLAEARALCGAAEKRLCRAQEWERACRDRGSANWPYGTSFAHEICNVSGGDVRLTGSASRCRTTSGVYDMSGNVAEWTEDGEIRGGSAMDRSRGMCTKHRARPGRQAAYSDVGFRCCADAIDPNAPRD